MSGEHPFHPQPGSNICVCGQPVASVAHHPPLDRIIRDRDEWNEHLANEASLLVRIIRDRDEWNEHLANEASLLVMAVPRVLRGLYLRRVARLRRRATT